ncbi:MAG TPA: TetR/AcrR family transcriptional regulator [Polyangiaceae bacterium]|nr:TetR/AcrR family transcriptional regulator [Polyangiaceae bacterium]
MRQALVEAALRALERQGLAELSLRALGRELGVSPRAPYRHFQTKETLLAAVAVEGLRRFEAFVTPRVAAVGPDPIAKLCAVAEAYVLFAVEHPAAFRVMYAPYATVEEDAPELVRARAEGHRANLELIVAAQAAGLLRPGDPMHHALAFWTSTHGLAVLLVEGQLGRYDRPIDALKLSALVSRLLLEGLLAAPGSGSTGPNRPSAARERSQRRVKARSPR